MANPADGESFPRGTPLIAQGDYGDFAYLIMSGLVEISRGQGPNKRVLAQLGPGSVVGEMALIDPAPRLAHAVALETTVAKKVTAQALEKALNVSPPFARYLLQTFIRNIRSATSPMAANNSPADTVGSETMTNLFLSEKNTDKIFDRRRFGPGDIIFRQGKTASEAYLIQVGTVSLLREEEDGAQIELRRLGPGEVFGEMALFEGNGPRFATAATEDGCSVEVIDQARFTQLMKSAPPIVQALMRNYAALIRKLPPPK